jgi:hypothetical protein
VSEIQDWQVKIQTLSPVWQAVFSLSLTLTIYLASCFFYLASKNAELLASLASVLKNLSTPLVEGRTWKLFQAFV